MSGPYKHCLGGKKRTYSDSSTNSTIQENDVFFSSGESLVPAIKKRHITAMDAEIIPKFRPDEKNCNVVTWLHKIDQLGDVYGWDNRDRQFVMQIRLRDSARAWYDDLEDYDLSWNDWKDALRTAFPRSTDFVDRLEEMLDRTKSNSETMTKYFHTKMALLKRCQIHGKDAISCIIRGLPHEIRANAKAFKCSTPQQLYFGYLSSLENYRTVEATATSNKSTWRRGNNSNIQATTSTATSSLATRQPPLPKICYACRRPGHEARDCISLLRCENCRRTGHTTANCWFGLPRHNKKRTGATQQSRSGAGRNRRYRMAEC